MKVYLITAGCYSDYHIITVFSSKAKAKEYINSFDRASYDTYGIEEYELDYTDDGWVSGMKSWSVLIYDDPNIGAIASLARGAPYQMDYGYNPNNSDKRGPYGYCQCWAKDEAHAIKICSERRAEFIANQHLNK